ncbi:MAG: hypothetical protein V3V08_10420 [Nannocystaceae bacterium]
MRKFAGLVVLLTLATSSVLVHDALATRRRIFPADADLLYLPPAHQLERMSLGYREALADLVWVRAVVFAGDRIGGKNFEWINKYLSAIMTLAPTFRRPYHWAGITFVYTGDAVITRDMIDRSIQMYRDGIRQFPEDHELLFALGMLLFRDVQSIEGFSAVERDVARSEGVELLRKSAAFGAPPLVRQLAATLVDSFASDQLAISFLETQMMQTSDRRYRRLLRKKLDKLMGTRATDRLDALLRGFLAERDTQLPYVPPPTYALIRDQPRRTARRDLPSH